MPHLHDTRRTVVQSGESVPNRRTHVNQFLVPLQALVFVLLACPSMVFPSPKQLVVGFGRAHPITYKDKNNHAAGFAVDVLTEAARREGVSLTWVPTASSTASDEMLAGEKIDLMAAGMVSPERQEKFHVSEPWWFDELILLTRKNTEGEVKRLGLSPIYQFLARQAYPNATLVPDRFGSASVASVCSGSADGALITHGDLHDIFLKRPRECADSGVELQSGDTGITIHLAVISRHSQKAIAQRLRSRINEMALDGSLLRFAGRHPPIPTSGAVRLAERARVQARTRAWTILAFVVTPVVVWMMFAYYRERRRERQTEQTLVTESQETRPLPLRRYTVAIAAMLAAVTIRYLLVPVVGFGIPWVIQSFAVAVAAQYGGIGAGLLATAVGILLGGFLYSGPPIWGFFPTQPVDAIGMAVFASMGICLSVFGERFIAARRRRLMAEQNERMQRQLIAEVRFAHEQLQKEHERLNQARQALQHSQQRLALAQRAGRTGTFDWDFQSNVNLWSDELLDLYGFKPGEAGGTCDDWIECIHPDDREAGKAAIQRSFETGLFELEFRIRRPETGEIRWMYGRADVVVDDTGKPVRTVGINVDITERKQAEQARRESDAKIRAVFDAIVEGVVFLNSRGEIEAANAAVAARFGLTLQQLTGTGFDSHTPIIRPDGTPLPADEHPAIIALRTGAAVHDVEIGIPASPGEITWMLVNAQPMRDQDGSLLGVVASFFDISGRRRAEKRLQESESFYRQTLESIPGMVFTTRSDGYCDYQSQQWVDYTGVPMSEHLGDGWNQLLHPDDRPRAFAAWRDAVEEKGPYDIEYRVRRHDGVYEWFKVAGRPIRDAAGRIVRWFGVALNIEALKKAEKATEEALEQRNLALEAAALGTWDYRLDTGEVHWDETSRRIFGATEEHRLDYLDAIARIHPDDRPGVDEAFRQAIAGVNDGVYHREFRVIWPDGSAHWVAGHGRVFFESNGSQARARLFAGVNMDITGHKHAQERLTHAAKLESIALLAGGVAHDFNNLLTIITTSASLALEECPSCEHSRAIVSAAERAAYLTKQLLAYAGKGQFVKKAVNLTDLVSNSKQLLAVSIPKRVNLVFGLASDLPAVEEDPGRIEQVLMNLVINAGEAIPPKTEGRIEVATGSDEVTAAMARSHPRYEVSAGRYVWLQVRDTGAGMDEATRSRIFDPFFSTKFTGRGLGLAAVEGIVRSSKGFIDVRSFPGAGTTFRVFLPASGKVRPSEISKPVEQPRQQRGSCTVLVVDDEEMVRELASIILKRHGYEVQQATNGKHALQVIAESPSLPSVVLLDLAMPVMGGDELLPILKERYPALKVIISSGYSEEEARNGFRVTPVDGFLQKPYSAVALANKIEEILGGRPQQSGQLVQFPRVG